MDSQRFKAQCPFCLETYLLDKSLYGRLVSCRRCHKSFHLEEKANNHEKQTYGYLKKNFQQVNDSYDLLPQSIVEDFARRFPNLPQGVWPVGKLLLDNTCQILPLSKEKFYAEGGAGIVQRVRRCDWNVDLIVKSPKAGVVLTEYGKKSFERECQTWIELGLHPNIVSCYFVRRIDGIPRLFAELAPDGTLNDWISSKRLYSGTLKEALARILDVSIQFAWGLEHAHQQGLLHLDVKPSNVMISGTTIKVTDFGLSKFTTNTARLNGIVESNCDGMTPSYCSPEQFLAFQIFRERRIRSCSPTSSTAPPITKQSDIWSWAISILAMFHGRSPCKMGGQTAAKVFEVFLKSPRPSDRPLMPEGIVDLLRWCFQEKPSDRPSSMQVIADQIVQIYNDEIGEEYTRHQPRFTELSAESFSNRAISLLDLGKTNEAIDLLHQASSNSPNNPQIVFNQTLALWRTGKLRDLQALQCLTDLTQNNPNNSTSFYGLGLIQFERGNLEPSIIAFTHALELDPSRHDVRRSLEKVEKLIPIDSRCITQYILAREDEKKTPSLFVNTSGELMLLKMTDQRIALIRISSGQILTNFILKNFQNLSLDSTNSFFAVSEDYKWKLNGTDSNKIIISLLTREKENKTKVSYQFNSIDWGHLCPRNCIVNLKSQMDNKREELSLKKIQFVPNASSINIIDLQTNKLIQRIIEEEQALTAFFPSVDGKWLVIGGDNSLIRIWNVDQNRCFRTFHGLTGGIEALWFAPQKNIIISLSKRNICQIWRITLICNHQSSIHVPHMLCSIDSSEEIEERLAKFDTALQITREATLTNNVEKLIEQFQSIRSIEGWKSRREQFEKLLEGRIPRSNLDEVIQTFQVQAHEGIISTIATSWNSSFFISAGKDQTIRLWTSSLPSLKKEESQEASNTNDFIFHTKEWKATLGIDYHYDWVRSIALSPNNRFLVSGSWDHRVVLWDLAKGVRLQTLSMNVKNITQLSFSPNGRTVAIATANGSVYIWDSITNNVSLRLDVGSGYTHAISFSRNGLFFVTATGDSTVRFWDSQTGIQIRELNKFPAPILAMDLSYDGNKIAVGCDNGKIYTATLTGPNTGQYRALSGHLGEINALKFFSDSKWLVSTGKDKTIRIWNLTEGTEIHKIASIDGEFCTLALDFPGLTLIAGSETGIIRSWSLHWNYNQCSLRSYDEIYSSLLSLSSYYANTIKLARQFYSRPNYYTTIQPPYKILKNFTEAGPLSDKVLQKIYAETKFRGLCNIPFSVIREIITTFWASNKDSKC